MVHDPPYSRGHARRRSRTPGGGTGKIVEADETFIGTKSYKFTQEGWKRKTGTAGKYAIVSLVERGGMVRSVTVSKVNAKIVREVLVRTANRNSTLSTDEAPYYKRVGREYESHVSVNHSKRQYVHGIAHTNTLEGYFSIFKRGMKGVYQHCGEKHLQRYVTEFDFRYNHREMTDFARTAHALNGISGKRLTYRRTARARKHADLTKSQGRLHQCDRNVQSGGEKV